MTTARELCGESKSFQESKSDLPILKLDPISFEFIKYECTAVGHGCFAQPYRKFSLVNLFDSDQKGMPIQLPASADYSIQPLSNHRFAIVGDKTISIFDLYNLHKPVTREIKFNLDDSKSISEISGSKIFNDRYLVRTFLRANQARYEHIPYDMMVQFIDCEGMNDTSHYLSHCDYNNRYYRYFGVKLPNQICVLIGGMMRYFNVEVDTQMGPGYGQPSKVCYAGHHFDFNFRSLPSHFSVDGVYDSTDSRMEYNGRHESPTHLRKNFDFVNLFQVNPEAFERLERSKSLGFMPDNKLLVKTENDNSETVVALFDIETYQFQEIMTIPPKMDHKILISPEGEVIILRPDNCFIYKPQTILENDLPKEKNPLEPILEESIPQLCKPLRKIILEYTKFEPSLFRIAANKCGFQPPKSLTSSSQRLFKTYMDNPGISGDDKKQLQKLAKDIEQQPKKKPSQCIQESIEGTKKSFIDSVAAFFNPKPLQKLTEEMLRLESGVGLKNSL